MRFRLGVALLSIITVAVVAQQPPADKSTAVPAQLQEREAQPESSANMVTLTKGTQIPLVLRQPISTKSAKVGDAVYTETNFPVTLDDQMAVPAGTYVQGVISHIKRPGRVSGRAEIQFHFTTMIFPSGYTVILPGSVENLPGAEHNNVKDKEGTIEHNGEKGKDVGQVASTAGTGAAIGGLATQSVKGAGIGAGIGGATGLAIAMLTRGSDVRLENGTPVQMVLDRPLMLNLDKVRPQNRPFPHRRPMGRMPTD
jgi:type IV secretion system protein VirB10